jgi:Domain of unknown function (DUF4412)
MRLAFLMIGALVAALPAAAEEWTLTTKHTRGDATSTSTDYIGAQKMRMTTLDGTEFIADYATGSLTILNAADKEYYVVTQQELEAVQADAAEQLKRMEAQMANLPAAFREKSTASAPPTVEVQKGKTSRTIAGHACDNYTITFGDVRQEACLAADLAVPPAAFDAEKRYVAAQHAMAGSMGTSMAPMWDKLKELKGFPVATTSMMRGMGRPQVLGAEATEIKKGALPADAFKVPAEFKKIESPLARMTHGPAAKK